MMGGLAGDSGAPYKLDSSRPGVFPAWENRRAARGGRRGKQGAKRDRPSAEEKHERHRSVVAVGRLLMDRDERCHASSLGRQDVGTSETVLRDAILAEKAATLDTGDDAVACVGAGAASQLAGADARDHVDLHAAVSRTVSVAGARTVTEPITIADTTFLLHALITWTTLAVGAARRELVEAAVAHLTARAVAAGEGPRAVVVAGANAAVLGATAARLTQLNDAGLAKAERRRRGSDQDVTACVAKGAPLIVTA